MIETQIKNVKQGSVDTVNKMKEKVNVEDVKLKAEEIKNIANEKLDKMKNLLKTKE